MLLSFSDGSDSDESSVPLLKHPTTQEMESESEAVPQKPDVFAEAERHSETSDIPYKGRTISNICLYQIRIMAKIMEMKVK